MPGTHELLSEFVRNGSERAFRELVHAYIDFVYSTALRIVKGNRLLAEDIAQNVFIDLSRKASALPPDVKLGGWLHRHTVFLAYKLLRHEGRRKVREQQALELHAASSVDDENLAQVTAVLDEVIQALGEEDRAAIILRFFEQLDFRSVGKALGRSEDAARMRVSRALEKLGLLLKGRGFILSVAGLGVLLGTKGVLAAPANLASATVVAAGISKSSGVFLLLKQAALTKLNVGLVGASLFVGLATFVLVNRTPAEKVEALNLAVPTGVRATILAREKTDPGAKRDAALAAAPSPPPRQASMLPIAGKDSSRGDREKGVARQTAVPPKAPLKPAPFNAKPLVSAGQGASVGRTQTPQRLLGDDRMAIQRAPSAYVPNPVTNAVETNLVVPNNVSAGLLGVQPQGNGMAEPTSKGDNLLLPNIPAHMSGASGNGGMGQLPAAGIYLKERGRQGSR